MKSMTRMFAVTGIIHVHSDFSSDGLCSIADLAGLAREAGFRFVGLTDHAEDLSSEDVEDFRRECEKHSDESFAMIPGLEFRCRGEIHILGLGAAGHIDETDPVVIASQVRAKGGVAILAHPGRIGYQCPPELFTALHGIEIWNSPDDGRFVPPLAGLHLLREARMANPAIFGFGGVDLHWIDQSPAVTLELSMNGTFPVSAGVVLDFLRSGRFTVRGRYIAFSARPAANWLTFSSFSALRKLYEVARTIREIALGES